MILDARDQRELDLLTHAAPSRVRVSRRQRGVRWLRRIIAGAVIVGALGLLAAPWRQNVPGTGRVIAFSPTDRTQSVEAPLMGRIVKWYVQEGSVVQAGAPIVDIADNDPRFPERLEQERNAAEERTRAIRGSLTLAEVTIASLESARVSAVANAELYVLIARDKRAEAEQDLAAAEAQLKAATLNHGRQKDLGKEGLSSVRTVELADLDLATATSKVEAARAKLRAATNEVQAAQTKLTNIREKEAASVSKAREALEKQRAELAKADADLANTEVQVSRQRAMSVVAPVSGVVHRLIANAVGAQVKAGDKLAQIVPDTSSRAVELWVRGVDTPLVTPGRKVRLQFEGWPAVQFVGWPSLARGTFGGEVALVDPTDDGTGRFRVLVVPDPDDVPWPAANLLRQGVRANGWLILDEVSVAYELWRQLNGFPPSLPPQDEEK